MVRRVLVEKKEQFNKSNSLAHDIKKLLGVEVKNLRCLISYEVENIEQDIFEKAKVSIFSEPNLDNVFDNIEVKDCQSLLVTRYLDGQFDQRANSASECVQFLSGVAKPIIRCQNVYVFDKVNDEDYNKIKTYIINPVDSCEGSLEISQTLVKSFEKPSSMIVLIEEFINKSECELKEFYDNFSFAMTFSDLKYVQDYFKTQNRQPTLTELKAIDTYWSDHCRHTTFLTELKDLNVESNNPHIKIALDEYLSLHKEHFKNRTDKYPCLMDIATIGARELKKQGYLDNLDQSDEINACSVEVDVDEDGKTVKWLIMFKNETHNHPTEIEPFGGAATCLGGAIRDPLSGRAYVYQAMRVTGAGNPLEKYSNAIKGKLPQGKLTKTALAGFSSYGNQIGLATGIVHEMYDDGYVAKRLETGYVIGGVRAENVRREKPQAGDLVILVGGDTGRDGCGGATGSSKSHTEQSVQTLGAEVQKGNAPEERKLQRLFKNPEASKLIIKCNDFGAGGVCVAIGELSDGIDIYLNKVSKKYEGLTATELAISESQERMAVVVKKEDAEKFVELSSEENLKASIVATVTDLGKLRMFYEDETIVDIDRSFLDTNGVKQEQKAVIVDNYNGFMEECECVESVENSLLSKLGELNITSQKGLGEVFDSTIGNGTVLMPFGGKNQLTPTTIMASKPPVGNAFTHTVTCSSFASYPKLMKHSPFVGAGLAVVSSVAKLVACGVKYDSIRLTFQEFFKKLKTDEVRWGEPLSALLGALSAQLGLKVGAIGGKDSMSGTFEDIDVPPTLISFGMGVTTDDNIIHNAFDSCGELYLLKHRKDEHGVCDYSAVKEDLELLQKLIEEKVVIGSAVVSEGGVACEIAKCLVGNDMGAVLTMSKDKLFQNNYGDIILLTNCDMKENLHRDNIVKIGEVNTSGVLSVQDEHISIDKIKEAFTSGLEKVFKTSTDCSGEVLPCDNFDNITVVNSAKFAKPRVFIPVFPGTNCELDTARAFEREGGVADVFVVKNLSESDIKQTIERMKESIDKANIIAFPGGFSGGDEPEGSGKFIATMFRNEMIRDSVNNLLYKRDGLAIGICNGFQALIKLGLLPYGEIGYQHEDSPTLSFNDLPRHVSTISQIRISSTKSPWLSQTKVGEIYNTAISHGEGKFIANDEHLKKLIANGQIATQYVDENGNPTMSSPCNPNGAVNGVEGIISLDGRILGKMGHTERYQQGLYQNIPGNFDMKIFKGGVKYFL